MNQINRIYTNNIFLLIANKRCFTIFSQCIFINSFYFSPPRTHASAPNPIKPQSSHHEALTAVEAVSQLGPVKSKTGVISHQGPEKQQDGSPQVEETAAFSTANVILSPTLMSLLYFRTAISQIIVILRVFQVRTVWKMQIPNTKGKMPVPVHIYALHLAHRRPEQAQHRSLKLLFLGITCPIQKNRTAISRKDKRLCRILF